MAYEIQFETRPNYLFARITGDNSSEAVFSYMQDILGKCEEISCFNVLIHECLVGPRLSILELYELMSEGSKRGLGKFHSVAFVDERMGDAAVFAENVGVNRGMPVTMFDDVEEATRWISRETDATTH